MTVERRDPPQDYERRGLWLAFAVGLVAVLRFGSPAFYGGQRFQVVLYVASLVVFGMSLCLCLLLVVPDLRARFGQRLRNAANVFDWAFGLFVLGLIVSIVAHVVSAIDAFDEDGPFG